MANKTPVSRSLGSMAGLRAKGRRHLRHDPRSVGSEAGVMKFTRGRMAGKDRKMDEFSYYLLTLLEGDEDLIRCAVKTRLSIEYPMEPEGRRKLMSLLPPELQQFCRLLKVERIEAVVCC